MEHVNVAVFGLNLVRIVCSFNEAEGTVITVMFSSSACLMFSSQ